ncbi:MAG: hypothetical protein JWL69_3913 [Phycisphaerales bacterium]|nr:hypothetical protein [Phycisphaerales bacterium]MDB5355935.1 hypothetical protein [Phycisphaerales bacterium]
MGIRQTLNEKPGLTTGVTAGIIVIAIVIIIWQSMGSRPSLSIPTKEFFSDDDGTTWFVDDATKIPPFDHGGKQANRVKVFRCGETGKPFVAWIESFDEQGKQKLEEAIKTNGKNALAGGAMRMGMENGMKVKRPKDPEWVQFDPADPSTLEAFKAVRTPICPDGSNEIIRIVRPGDKNSLP